MSNMNELMYIDSNLTTSSREIAELTGKRHADVLRDIRVMFDELGIKHSFALSEYKDPTERILPYYNLPKRETLILVSGYSTELRARIIDRWQELEASLYERSTWIPSH